MTDYELEAEELAPPKPYTPEQQDLIDDINKEIADAYSEFMSVC